MSRIVVFPLSSRVLPRLYHVHPCQLYTLAANQLAGVPLHNICSVPFLIYCREICYIRFGLYFVEVVSICLDLLD